MSKLIVTGSQQDVANRENISLAESFLNTELVVIFDNSGSMMTRDTPQGISRVKLAQQHLTTLQGKHQGKIALICFADDVQYSPGGIVLSVGSGTDLAKSLRFAHERDFDDIGVKTVVISDGEPNNEDEAIHAAMAYRSRIDVIYCGGESSPRGREFLERLANVSGGRFFTSDNPGELLAQTEMLLLGG